MSEQKDLNITLVNEWSLDFVDDQKDLNLMKFADGSLEIDSGYSNEVEAGYYANRRPSFNLSKEQMQYLIKWYQR